MIDAVKNNKPNKNDDNDKGSLLLTIVLFGLFCLFILFSIVFDKYDNSFVEAVTLTTFSETVQKITTNESTLNKSIDGFGGMSIEEYTDTLLENRTETRLTVVFPLDINTASVDELMMVKGLGKVLSERIVEYRDINGYFYSLDELLNVKGIGESKLKSLDGYICIIYDDLPETLPPKEIEADEGDTYPETTSVPLEETTDETVVKNTPMTEEIVIETEEFITDTDDEFETLDIYTLPETKEYDRTSTLKTTEEEYYPDFPLELNSANIKDLTYIKGIGEATAAKIVNYAKTVGFTSVEDLLNISGIGQSKLRDIMPYVYVDSSGVTTTVSDSDTNTDITSADTGSDLPTETESSESSESTETTTVNEVYRVNINTCNKEDLMQLPGIDEETADRILVHRNEFGSFKNIEELSFIISDKELADIWDYVFA